MHLWPRMGAGAVALALALAPVFGEEPASQPLSETLVNLGSGDFAAREAAQKELDKIPVSQMHALWDLADAQRDPEVKARIEKRVGAMALEIIRAQSSRPLPAAAHFTGRVVDAAGQPIADAVVRAKTSAMGRNLWWGFAPEARTDKAGRYDLGVPFRDILYFLSLEPPGYQDASQSTLPRAKRWPTGSPCRRNFSRPFAARWSMRRGIRCRTGRFSLSANTGDARRRPPA